MKRFSPRLFALGLVLGAAAAVVVLAASAYARGKAPRHAGVRATASFRAHETGQPVIDWNRVLLARAPVGTPPTCVYRSPPG